VAKELAVRHEQREHCLYPPAFASHTDSEGTWIDLRGFPLGLVYDIHGEFIDFSHAKSVHEPPHFSPIWVFRCHLRRVRFDHAHTFYEIRGTFDACTFAGIHARRAYLIGEFRDCVFESSNLYAGRPMGEFHRCSFANANLKKANLSRSRFERCDFRAAKFERGAALGTCFVECDFTDVDFRDTFRDFATQFIDCKMDGFRSLESTRMFGIDIPTT
jgi:uncharacterized protein YjbI with pentapeptide repeats